MTEDRQTGLIQVPFFAELGRTVLADLAAVITSRDYGEGEVLFREGAHATHLYLVMAGEIRVTRRRHDGTEIEVHRLRPGDYAGVTSLLTDQARSATLTAVGAVTCWLIAREDLQGLVARHPPLSAAIMRYLSRRFRSESGAVAELRSQGNDGRIRVAVFDSKSYDRDALGRRCPDGIVLHHLEPRLARDTAALAAGFPVVCAFVNDHLDHDTLSTLAAGGTRLVAMRCAGYNNVDLQAARDHGITVVRVPAYSPHAVAEHALALLLTLNRRIHRAFNRVREGNFTLDRLVGVDLHDRTAGILGVGKIGRCMVRICRGLGMRVLGWDAYPNLDFAAETGMEFVDKERVFAESHVISLHAPLLPATHHLVDEAAIARMRPGAILINTSRGGLIDTEALLAGLRRGTIGGAGLDVYEEEAGYFFEDHSGTVITDDALVRLISYPNVIVTSHQAFLTEEALANIADTTFENIRQFLAGEEVENAVG